jgi:hypothetical protein
MIIFPIRTDLANTVRDRYSKQLLEMSEKQLLTEFFTYLDYQEESDSGRVFNPVTIGSCRVMMTEPLDMLLQRMRDRSN